MDRDEYEYQIGNRYEEMGEFRDFVNTWVRRSAVATVTMAPVSLFFTHTNGERIFYAGVLPAVGIIGAVAVTEFMNRSVGRFQDELLNDAFELDQEDIEE